MNQSGTAHFVFSEYIVISQHDDCAFSCNQLIFLHEKCTIDLLIFHLMSLLYNTDGSTS